MHELRTRWLQRLHPRRLDPSIGAIAGLAGAVSVIVGFMAQNAMGHGWHRAFLVLHLAKKPLIVRLAPVMTGIAVGIATAAALVRFYNWCREARGIEVRSLEKQADIETPAKSTSAVEQGSAAT